MPFTVTFKFAPQQTVGFIGSQTTGTVTRLLVAEDGKILVEVQHDAMAYEAKTSIGIWPPRIEKGFKPVGVKKAINFYPEGQLCEVGG